MTLLVGAKGFKTTKTTSGTVRGSAYTGRVGGTSSFHLVEDASMNEGVRRTPVPRKTRQERRDVAEMPLESGKGRAWQWSVRA